MNLRRDTFAQFFLILVFGFSLTGIAAEESEMDEVIDLTKVVKPKKTPPGGSQRENQEAEIESQVNEYGEGGSGLKPAPKKTTVGEQLSTLERRKDPPSTQSLTPPASSPEISPTTEVSEDKKGDEESKSGGEGSGQTAESAESAAPEEVIAPVPEEASAKDANLEPDRDPVSPSNSSASHDHAAHGCSCARKTQFEPYVERRQKWGTLFSLGTSFYNPINYEPDYAVGSFLDAYGSNNPEAFELSIGAKLNLGKAGSLALLASGGTYRKVASSGASLSLTPVSIGANYYLDTLFREPYVVPYFGGGAYTLFFRESLASNAVGGRTGFGFYYSAGLAFQLDWMDEYGDLSQYSESDVENTFLYVEGRGITGVFYNEAVKQRNFSNSLFAAVGLRFEF